MGTIYYAVSRVAPVAVDLDKWRGYDTADTVYESEDALYEAIKKFKIELWGEDWWAEGDYEPWFREIASKLFSLGTPYSIVSENDDSDKYLGVRIVDAVYEGDSSIGTMLSKHLF